MKLSIVIPVFDEQENIPEMYRRLLAVLPALADEFEILFVDDGSRDDSARRIEALCRQDPRVKAIFLSRNFGHQRALTAGLDHATGDAVVVMDADLQHPPELLHEMVRLWRDGYEIVYTLRQPARHLSWWKRSTAALFYRTFHWLSRVDLPFNAADFRLFDRKVVMSLRRIRERARFLRGLTGWMGFRSIGVSYEVRPRFSGQSHYGVLGMIHLAVDGIVSFSTKPLYLSIYVGFALAVAGLFYGVFAVYARLVTHRVIPGWTSLLTLFALIGGIQLILMGVIGIYIGRIYEEVKQRPLYLIRKALGISEKEILL